MAVPKKKASISVAEKIRRALGTFQGKPDVEYIAKKVRCTKQRVWQTMYDLKKQKAKTREAKPKPPTAAKAAGNLEKQVKASRRKRATRSQEPTVREFRIRASIPKGSKLVLQLDNCNSMIGTCILTETGIKYIPANSKKKPEREMPFSVMQSIISSGLLG